MTDKRVSTGSEALDALLGGGLERRILTQVYGEPGSGKSTICTIVAVSVLRSGKDVIFFDTEGFSVERFRQIAGEDAEKLAENLYIYEPMDFEQQGILIAESETLLRSGTVGAIIMDSATALYRTELGFSRDTQRKLAKQMVHLLGLSKKYDIPALLTNQVYMDVDTDEYRGLGGTVLSHLSKAVVRLEKRNGFRRAVLEKHRSLPEGDYFDFVIVREGISRV
ncbi:MAG TPA: DNA repair and recombination protein RadB [Methanomicrobiales archaeon]|nr:DNA repair and recombination protein RadB [Methanomicrobiales archaeon]